MKDEIIIYQTNKASTRLEVRIEDETLWLTQNQIVELFTSSKANISEHIKNIFQTNELEEMATVRKFRTVQNEGGRNVTRTLTHYNLDMIISVGYRVNSIRGTQFRIWANKVIRDYLLRGYAINQRFEHIENEVHNIKNKLGEIDLQLRTSLPPNEGIFFEGQVFDAYLFVTDIIKLAKKSIFLIDNYVDESVLGLLSKRDIDVSATIYTSRFNKELKDDLKKHNTQYPSIEIKTFYKSHDRFLIIDLNTVYHIGASLKDLGKKWFAFSKIALDPIDLIKRLEKQ